MMIRSARDLAFSAWLGALCLAAMPLGCRAAGGAVIVPAEGYSWPARQRDYWPTAGWRSAPPEDHHLDAQELALADKFARADPHARALLVVKEGYLVLERYYGSGGIDQSTNLSSVTKSVVSALVGQLTDRGLVRSPLQPMVELLPRYGAFGGITLQQVLTHTTGLAWSESGRSWVEWILSDDWVASALARGPEHHPGTRFLYSSANSQFLTTLVHARTGQRPGELAKRHLFDPLGIRFEPLTEAIAYDKWDQYKDPLPQSWRRDPRGIETGGFGLYLTARDMAKFGVLYLNRGLWEGRQIVSEQWAKRSTRDQQTDIHGRYSYGYHWWITLVAGHPAFLASGFGGQLIGVVPSLDLVVVLKYDALNPVHPKPGTAHDDMHLFELVVEAAAGRPETVRGVLSATGSARPFTATP